MGIPVRRLCTNQARNDIGLATRIIRRAVKHRLLVYTPKTSDSVGPVVMQVGSEVCISNKCPVMLMLLCGDRTLKTSDFSYGAEVVRKLEQSILICSLIWR